MGRFGVMPANESSLRVYEQLAELFDQRQDARQRDVFLVLAADTAYYLGQLDEAERCRQRLVRASPHSLLKPFLSFREALQSHDIQEYIADLRRQYPLAQAEKLLHSSAPPPEPPPFRLIGELDDTLAGSPAHWPPPAAVPLPVAASSCPLNGVRENNALGSPYETPRPPVTASAEGLGNRWGAYLLFTLALVLGLGWLLYTFIEPLINK